MRFQAYWLSDEMETAFPVLLAGHKARQSKKVLVQQLKVAV